jgi:eukaryotic-like serine/threonine-protein kinase
MLTPDSILQGRYRIVRQLGQGGMGAVYEAVDQRLDTTVALKETFFADERLRKQFEREARLLARLHHPALPRVSDHFSEGDGQFLVMQFIPGDDLSEMMTRKRGPFPPDQVLTWADQLLDALDYLHTQDPQIVHRDIKPQNLKLTSRGQIILLDFGLAKGQPGEISRVTTGASIFGYTPNYAPLEQIQGLGTNSRSDLYSLGATLYHLMTGVKPPDALTRAAALVNGQADPLIPPSQANPAVATEVDRILGKAMSQNREQRYSTASDMRKALHGTVQASTVVNRAEAQTMLFPQAATTVALPTQTIPRQQTVRAAGETTVVRSVDSRSRRSLLPWALSGLAVLLAACVLGFYALQRRNVAVVQLTPTPSPTESPAVSTPSVASVDSAKPSEQNKVATPQPTSVPKKPRSAETKKATPPTPNPPEVQGVGEGHEPQFEPTVPSDPTMQRPNRVRRPIPQTKVLPGGVIIRNFPDGSSLITTPDGKRVYVSPDGKQQVLYPGGKINRRRPTPSPSP